MTDNIIICGNGHGIECVYLGLRQKNKPFILCTEDEKLKEKAAVDGVPVVRHYAEAIKSTQDIVLTAAYKPKITAEDLTTARFVNIHYALLPKYRGMHAIVWAILNGESHVGFTLHETSPLLDQGPVIYQEAVPVGNQTSWELMMIIDELVTTRIHDALIGYAHGKITPTLQCEADAIFVAPRNKEDCRVRWDNWNATFFSRVLKALVSPYPLPFFEHNGQIIEIIAAQVMFKDYIEVNGHLVYVDNEHVYIKIPGGLLRLETIRADGVEMPANQRFQKIGVRFK
jgi:methionyl-tRNA formyltransferase